MSNFGKLTYIQKTAYIEMKKDTANEIRTRRKDLGLTQDQIAKKIGVSNVAVGGWERGESKPRGENLLKLASILECAPGDLVDSASISKDAILDSEAAIISDAYKSASPEVQEMIRSMFGIQRPNS